MGPNIYKVAFNINSFPKIFASFSDYMNFIDTTLVKCQVTK